MDKKAVKRRSSDRLLETTFILGSQHSWSPLAFIIAVNTEAEEGNGDLKNNKQYYCSGKWKEEPNPLGVELLITNLSLSST